LGNSHREFALNTGHLTPALLHEELANLRELKGDLPRITVVHMDPMLEKEIAGEIAAVAQTLNTPITLAYEGMPLHI
jgi:hypothetical protein